MLSAGTVRTSVQTSGYCRCRNSLAPVSRLGLVADLSCRRGSCTQVKRTSSSVVSRASDTPCSRYGRVRRFLSPLAGPGDAAGNDGAGARAPTSRIAMSASAAPAAPVARSQWFVSPAVDLMVGCGLWSLPLMLLTSKLNMANAGALAFGTPAGTAAAQESPPQRPRTA